MQAYRTVRLSADPYEVLQRLLPVPRGSSIRDTTGGDFDGDGDVDLVMTTDEGQLLMLLNEGAGSFTLSQQIDVDPPIGWLDRHVGGGAGVVVDDFAAAGIALVVYAITVRVTGWPP